MSSWPVATRRPDERVLRALAERAADDAAAARAHARRHKVPPAELDPFVPDHVRQDPVWQAAVADSRERGERLAAAGGLVAGALTGVDGVAVAADGFGWRWSSDVDVFVAGPEALDTAAAALAAGGLIDLAPLLQRLRGGSRRTRLFAAVDGHEVLGVVELTLDLRPGEPAAAAIARADQRPGDLPALQPADAARRRAAKLAATRPATARGVLELLALDGLRTLDARAARHRHAALARELGVAIDGPTAPFSPAWVRARARGAKRRTLGRARARQVRIAFCGVDGAGKSTQSARLVDHLKRCEVGAEVLWTRLGNKASGPVEQLAKLAQRLLPSGSHSFQATRAAAGREPSSGPSPTAAPPLTRRGVVGWGWALLVTVDYILRAQAGCRHAGAIVLVLDRSLPDALVELEDDYGVRLELGLQRRLLERFAPEPHLTFYLRLPGAAAKARKDDMFTAAELDVQRERYERLLETQPRVVILDAQQDREALAVAVLRAVAAL